MDMLSVSMRSIGRIHGGVSGSWGLALGFREGGGTLIPVRTAGWSWVASGIKDDTSGVDSLSVKDS
jgi:hypothetical protein